MWNPQDWMYTVNTTVAMAPSLSSVQAGTGTRSSVASTTTSLGRPLRTLPSLRLPSLRIGVLAPSCKSSHIHWISLSSSFLANFSAIRNRASSNAMSNLLVFRRHSYSNKMISIRCAISSAPNASGESILPQGATEVDAFYMRMCVDLARQAVGKTSPNPIVGCVIVKDGRIVGRGFHPKAGEPHAEVFALREAGPLAQGATAYVSLEPCNHYGRTPPCSQALVKAKLKRVVVGVVDPNPQVGGKGIKTLRNAGIEVVVGVEETLCLKANESFMHRMATGRPFVTLRYSMSMDGGFLGNMGLSNAQGGLYSKLLQENDAVVITDAAVLDDPDLLSSEPGAKQPLRVILARSLDLPVESKVFDTSYAKTLVLADQKSCIDDIQRKSADGKSIEARLRAGGVDVVMMNDLTLENVLSVCYQLGATSVLLDSRGPVSSGLENFLGQQALDEEAAQKVVVQVAPIFLGENRTEPCFRMDSDLVKLERVSSHMVGQDVVIEGYFPERS
ncbi:riboflavin biosynthesis protein PYRD, chloroplastic isoform X3 [Physcomitrium patens]|uniref:riboflavin biosynthesis protein PYRD, chloroplastic isoform X3 n=1 Tax=Physcomitrium patens TaxID=3218 RepID=UPI000D168296|nr:riboflavin biosynthesis protein PYRD, chloroplastic-like isoform X3 [Physcomitrium patens]|eukprot:XP_024379572.1 riboflavin biosynthesis protein PYRD, chloroplastic-like isoform X3 [Physcomitrella patens]